MPDLRLLGATVAWCITFREPIVFTTESTGDGSSGSRAQRRLSKRLPRPLGSALWGGQMGGLFSGRIPKAKRHLHGDDI